MIKLRSPGYSNASNHFITPETTLEPTKKSVLDTIRSKKKSKTARKAQAKKKV